MDSGKLVLLCENSTKTQLEKGMTVVKLLMILNIFAALAARPRIEEEQDLLPKKLQKLIKGVGADCSSQMQGVIKALLDLCDPENPCEDQISEIFGNTPPDIDWFRSLSTPDNDAMLWAGFWPGGEEGRTTKDALFHFAKLMDMTTVHPSTKLGTIVAENHDLTDCSSGNPTAKKRTSYFWTSASKAFVRAMMLRNQANVVVLVHKSLQESDPRRLSNSVLYRYEIPEIPLAIMSQVRNCKTSGSSWWPRIILVDLWGDCASLKEVIDTQMQASKPEMLGSCQKPLIHKRDKEGWVGYQKCLNNRQCMKSTLLPWFQEMPVECIECGADCKLDQSLAQRVRQRFRRPQAR